VNVERMMVNQRPEGLASAFFFAAGDVDRRAVAQPDVAVHVARPQWLFEPANVELCKGLGAGQSGSRIPHAAGVDQQRRAVADSFTRPANQFNVERLALSHWLPAELDRLVTGIDPTLPDFLGLLSVTTKQNRGIGFDAIVLFAAEQAMNGLFEVFAFEVPQRHVHRAHRADGDGGPPEVHRAAIHFLPEPLRLERIFADQNFAQTAGDVVAERRVDDGLDDFG